MVKEIVKITVRLFAAFSKLILCIFLKKKKKTGQMFNLGFLDFNAFSKVVTKYLVRTVL